MVLAQSEQEQRRYFEAQMADNVRWASRLGVPLGVIFQPDAAVLDFGCGHGALCVQAAALGADVTGLDTSVSRTAFAARHSAAAYPGLAGRICFRVAT